MGKYIRITWIMIHLTIATLLISSLVVIVGVVDVRKKITGILPRIWGKWVLWSTGIDYEVKGLENLKPNRKYVFVGNHESALDIPIAVASLPYNIVFLAKKELFRIPLFGWGMWAAGMVRVDRQNREKARTSIEKALAQIARMYISILVYPEGTRSSTGELQEFKKGSFILAIRSKLAVVPITITGARDVLPKNTIRFRKGKAQLIVDKPIHTEEMVEKDRNDLMIRTRETITA
ncbi:MAG: 1-acyl-sn-glycerol-3-phosphate acyltransferase, partial [FCB group bacterium]|nr:1-acyl-sn-glycerol-3-phosphate acyltransferase [FCB group bacterium]